jgi:hypothetical protein
MFESKFDITYLKDLLHEFLLFVLNQIMNEIENPNETYRRHITL